MKIIYYSILLHLFTLCLSCSKENVRNVRYYIGGVYWENGYQKEDINSALEVTQFF